MIDGLLRTVSERSNSKLTSTGECMESGEFGELPEGDKGGVYTPFNKSASRKIGQEIGRRTNCSLDVEEPGGRPSRQVRLWRHEQRSAGDGLETSPADTCHTCLAADLCIRFWDRFKHRLLSHQHRWHVGSDRREVRVIYRRWNRWLDKGRLIIGCVGS